MGGGGTTSSNNTFRVWAALLVSLSGWKDQTAGVGSEGRTDLGHPLHAPSRTVATLFSVLAARVEDRERVGLGLGPLGRTRELACLKRRRRRSRPSPSQLTNLSPDSLKGLLKSKGLTASWQSAVTYQLIHSLALLSLSTREVDHSSTVKWDWVGGCWAFGACA